MATRFGRWAPAGARFILTRLILVAGFSAVAPGAGAGPPGLQPYADPDKQFTIEYPQGWHVQHVPAGGTYFYLDDPEQGTSFTFTPAGSFKGEMDAGQALKVLVSEIRKTYPNFTVVGQKQKPMQGTSNGTIIDVAAIWTNAKHVAMKGWGSLGVIKQVGKGRTVFSYMGYQAPSKDFAQFEPIFDRMIRSLRFGKPQ